MVPILFFLLGLPAALLAERLIARLTRYPLDEAEEEANRARPLPWQSEPWSTRLRFGLAAWIPVLMAVAGSRFSLGEALLVSPLIVAFVVCTGTDLLRYMVPNAITYPGIVLALLAAALMPGQHLASAFLAAAFGGGIFLVLAIISRGGLGLGDVKLAALIGAALGLQRGYEALFFGMLFAGIIVLLLLGLGAVRRQQAVPYAPFLALTAVGVILLRGAAFAPL